MLIFDRKSFKSGTQVVKETVPVQVEVAAADAEGKPVLDEEGKPVMVLKDATVEKTYVLMPRDKGKPFAFHNEDAILAKYPVLFRQATAKELAELASK